MNSAFKHMDDWLQHSAAQGNLPVQENDWQLMKEMLHPRRKRRFLFWWWIVPFLLTGAGISFLMMKRSEPVKIIA